LILRKLESLPSTVGGVKPPLGAGPGTSDLAIERLLAVLTTSTDLFFRAAALLPRDLPLMKDARFRKDRADFFHAGKGGGGGGGGGDGDVRDREKENEVVRAEALREIRDAMALVEGTLLADGRDWILGGEGPSLADVEAVWVFHWLIWMPGALDKEQVSAERFPKVYAWVERFQRAVGEAKGAGQVTTVGGEEAAGVIKGEETRFFEGEGEVDGSEPIVRVYGLEKGQRVEVWPTDSGAGHRDRGRLVGLGADEVVWETDAGVRVHAPRHGFRVQPASGSGRGASL
jgi:glutathione S-transferase